MTAVFTRAGYEVVAERVPANGCVLHHDWQTVIGQPRYLYQECPTCSGTRILDKTPDAGAGDPVLGFITKGLPVFRTEASFGACVTCPYTENCHTPRRHLVGQELGEGRHYLCDFYRSFDGERRSAEAETQGPAGVRGWIAALRGLTRVS